MKTLKLLVIGMLLLFAGSVEAQISVRVNLGVPPQWGPSGYSDVRYYYLPDVEAYYDVPSSMFIYYNGVTWIHRSSLPTRYRNYDLYNGYKVPMSDYRGDSPYTNFRKHKVQYARGYRGQEQRNIGQRPERANYNNDSRNNQRVTRSQSDDRRGNDKNRDKKNDRGRGNDNKR
jgi:hypothetical protein